MLTSAVQHLRVQRRYSAVAVAAARRAWRLGSPLAALPSIAALQLLAAESGLASVADMLEEQNITAEPVAAPVASALSGVASDGRPLRGLLENARDLFSLERIAVTQVADAARVAAGLGIAARPGVGWTRMVTPPCCARCAVLAGKWFRWNQGFQRHPLCDCRHIPTREATADDVRVNPRQLFTGGQVRGATHAELQAVRDGADVSQVINARRSLYVDEAGRSLTLEAARDRGVNGVRVTPEQIYREARDRADALRILRRFGYVT